MPAARAARSGLVAIRSRAMSAAIPPSGDTLRYFAFMASVYRYWGEGAAARMYQDSARTDALALIARHEDDVFTHAALAIADAYLGRGKEAVEAGQRTCPRGGFARIRCGAPLRGNPRFERLVAGK
jgi:hypothetical protein